MCGSRMFIIISILLVGITHVLTAPKRLIKMMSNRLDEGKLAASVVAHTLSIQKESWKIKSGDTSEETWSALEIAMTTMVVGDLGGGVLAPYISTIIEKYTESEELYETLMTTFKKYNDGVVDVVDETVDIVVDIADDAAATTTAAAATTKTVTKKKSLYQGIFDSLKNAKGTAAGVIKENFKSMKKFMRLKTLGKVIGPIFDIVGIALDVKILVDCYRKGCQTRDIISASLGIVSGVIGVGVAILVAAGKGAALGTMGGPALMAVGTVIGIASALVAIWWPDDKPKDLLEDIKDKFLDLQNYHSREEISNLTKKLYDSINGNFYIVKAGHLLVDPNALTADKKEKWRNVIHIGGGDVSRFDDITSLAIGKNEWEPFTNLYRWNNNTQPFESATNNVYMVNYDYANQLIRNPKNIKNLKLRENVENIKTELKSGKRTSRGINFENEGNRNDVIIIGDMPYLNKNHQITIKTHKGNDSLNLDGLFGRNKGRTNPPLDADLGKHGLNVLTFLGVDMKRKEKDKPYGIRFGVNGTLAVFFNKDNESSAERSDDANIDHYGKVRFVDILLASTGMDEITLSSEKSFDEDDKKWAPRIETGFDLLIYKFAGSAVYTLDINHELERLWRHPEINASSYKITDNTVTLASNLLVTPIANVTIPNPCDFNKNPPTIFITNLPDGAVANDIVYVNRKTIYVYANVEKPSVTKSTKPVTNLKRQCKETDVNAKSIKGGEGGKQLLATIEVRIRCPFILYARDINNNCVLARWENDVDVIQSAGKYNLELNRTGLWGITSELLILQCSQKGTTNTIRLKNSTTIKYLMIKGDFLAACGFGTGSTADDHMKLIPKNDHVLIEIKRVKHSLHTRIELPKSLERVITDYGTNIWEKKIHDKKTIDLIGQYYKESTKESVSKMFSEEDRFKNMEACVYKDDEVLQNVGIETAECLENADKHGNIKNMPEKEEDFD